RLRRRPEGAGNATSAPVSAELTAEAGFLPSPLLTAGPSRASAALLLIALLPIVTSGCATIRVTDPPRSATEQFLESEATRKAIDQLSSEALRDRKTYIDTSYLITAAFPTPENLFFVAELRNR